MPQGSEKIIDFHESNEIKDLHGNMKDILRQAVDKLECDGICLFVFSIVDTGLRMAHMSNMERDQITELMKTWLSHQEKEDERDYIN